MMGSCTRRGTSARQSGGTDAEACAQAAAERRQTLALLRRQNRLLERLLEAMGVEP